MATYKEMAEDVLSTVFLAGSSKTEAALFAIAFGILHICDQLDEISCVVAIPAGEEEEEEEGD